MATVVHVLSGLKVGGAEMALHRLIVHGDREKFRHVVFALSPEGGMVERFREAGADLFVFDLRSHPLVEFWKLIKALRRANPDVVQTWMYHADLIGGLAARLAGCRAVVWGIRTTYLPQGGSRATRWVRWACARLSTWVPQAIVCAAEASRALHVELGYAADRMVVIPNGYAFDSLRPEPAARERLRRSWSIPDQGLVVGLLGRFSPDKDPETFVRAAARVAAVDPRVSFLMVGRGQEAGNESLAAWIAAAGTPERFILLGERSDVPDVLSAMDVFCLSSCTEGFPNVLAEAMALGLPCVSTQVGDAAFLLGDGGLLVPPKDPEALAQGLVTVLNLGEQGRARLGAKGRERVHSEFTIQRACDRFSALYRDVLGKGKR